MNTIERRVLTVALVVVVPLAIGIIFGLTHAVQPDPPHPYCVELRDSEGHMIQNDCVVGWAGHDAFPRGGFPTRDGGEVRFGRKEDVEWGRVPSGCTYVPTPNESGLKYRCSSHVERGEL